MYYLLPSRFSSSPLLTPLHKKYWATVKMTIANIYYAIMSYGDVRQYFMQSYIIRWLAVCFRLRPLCLQGIMSSHKHQDYFIPLSFRLTTKYFSRHFRLCTLSLVHSKSTLSRTTYLLYGAESFLRS